MLGDEFYIMTKYIICICQQYVFNLRTVLGSVRRTDANQYKNYYVEFGARTDAQIR